MRTRGIVYDTGFVSAPGTSTHEPFDPEAVARDMRVIRDDLHADAVRVTGGHPDRLEIAARHAAAAGLAVWFSPFVCDLTLAEVTELLLDCADRAERLRRDGAEVVFLTGSELALFTVGFLPGDTLPERVALLSDPTRLGATLPDLHARMDAAFATIVPAVRERFGGPVGYASLPFERVDWTRFDVLATDAGYRSASLASRFRDDIAAFVAAGRELGRPVAITEFGATTHRGAGDLGGHGDAIVEWDERARPVRLAGEPIRDEHEQAGYLLELLDVFDDAGVDAAFVNTFARRDLPHGVRGGTDYDMASFGIVAVHADGSWRPKEAFHAVAAAFGR